MEKDTFNDYGIVQKEKPSNGKITLIIMIVILSFLHYYQEEPVFNAFDFSEIESLFQLFIKVLIVSLFCVIFTQFLLIPYKKKSTNESEPVCADKKLIKNILGQFIFYIFFSFISMTFIETIYISYMDFNYIDNTYMDKLNLEIDPLAYITFLLILTTFYFFSRLIYTPVIRQRNYSLKVSIIQSWRFTKGKNYLVKAAKKYLLPILFLYGMIIILTIIFDLMAYYGIHFIGIYFVSRFAEIFIPFMLTFVFLNFVPKGIEFYNIYLYNNIV